MATMNHATDALPFTNGLAAATQSKFEVLLLHKDVVLSQSDSIADVHGIPQVRQLQSSSSDDDDNETSVNTTTASTITANSTNLTDLNNSVAAEIGQSRGWH